MSIHDRPEIVPLGATALLARFGDAIDRELTLRLTALVRHLDDLALDGLVDLVPAYTTLLAILDPGRLELESLARHIDAGWRGTAPGPDARYPGTRTIEIPVVYGGEAGPDLGDVARHTGLDPDEVIHRHGAAEYTVGALGFSPGFAFLIGLPPELATPRRETPRTRVPAGSVGIAGPQTGIYSLPTPGGWQLIGRTPRRMFDPDASPEAELRPGDTVRFVPVAAEDAPAFHDADMDAATAMPARGAIEIVEPGVQSTVQDLGRPGQGRFGITPGGALDRSALVAGNRLLGNPDGGAAIEWTLLPPAIRFHAPCRIALTGADPSWRLNDRVLRIGEAVDTAAGDTLRANPAGMTGARGYLCVAGGIDVPEVRGSRSLDLSAGFGGGYGRPLRAADRLAVAEKRNTPNPDNTTSESGSDNDGPDPTPSGDLSARPFRVVRGPQADRFGEAAWRTFLSEPYTVDAQSNRMGLRLSGPAIAPEGGADIVSEGVATGAVQVTGAGQPIVLLPGRATIGGYTKIATVIEADHDRLGQLPPGAPIRFAEVSLDEAEAALRAWRPSVHGGLTKHDKDTTMTDEIDTGDAWTPGGVIRLIRELAGQDVRAFALRVESAGIEIAIDRGGGMPDWPQWTRERVPERSGHDVGTEVPDNPEMEQSQVIIAPLLGTFWRRPSPQEPNFVEPGDTVEAGQTVGLIEVMKSFHEVTASEAGIVRDVLVEDGVTVEYGQPLIELGPAEEG